MEAGTPTLVEDHRQSRRDRPADRRRSRRLAVAPKRGSAIRPGSGSAGRRRHRATRAGALRERQRGLTFTSPVRPELLDDTAFPARLREVDARDADPAATAASQVSLTALGLLEPGTDLRAQTSRLLDAAVLGFYDPKTKALVVRGNRATPGVRATHDQGLGL